MASLVQIRNKANSILAPFWTELVKKQNSYFAKHGKYFQLLVSPTDDVIDGADSLFEVKKANDEPHSFDVDVNWSSPIPFQIRVHQKNGSETGFVAIVDVVVNRDKYRRIRDSENNDTDWYKEPAVELTMT